MFLGDEPCAKKSYFPLRPLLARRERSRRGILRSEGHRFSARRERHGVGGDGSQSRPARRKSSITMVAVLPARFRFGGGRGGEGFESWLSVPIPGSQTVLYPTTAAFGLSSFCFLQVSRRHAWLLVKRLNRDVVGCGPHRHGESARFGTTPQRDVAPLAVHLYPAIRTHSKARLVRPRTGANGGRWQEWLWILPRAGRRGPMTGHSGP